MSKVWQALEELAHSSHISAEWAKCSGEHFTALRAVFLQDTQQRARHIECPHGCGCRHEIVEHEPGQLVAVCRCEPRDCQDFTVRAEDMGLWELNAGKFGRAVARAFECDLRDTPLPLPMTWQIGAKFASGVPVFLTIQPERSVFNQVVAELAARQRQPFILLTPTGRWLDAKSHEILGAAKAGCFDLESHLTLLPSGLMQAKKRGGELFGAFQLGATEETDENVARQVFALIEKLEAGPRAKKPTVMDVFRLYCIKGKTTDQIVEICKSSKGTVMNRIEDIRRATRSDPDKLRAFSPYLQKIEESISDSRAEHIHRKSLASEAEDEDQD